MIGRGCWVKELIRERGADGVLGLKRDYFRSVFGAGIIVLATPFCLLAVYTEHYLLSAALLLFIIVCAVDGYSLINNKAQPVSNTVAYLSYILMLLVAVVSLGASSALWFFPFVVGIFMIFPRLESNFYSILGAVALSMTTYLVDGNISFAIRFLISISVTAAFCNLIVFTVNDLQSQLLEYSIKDPLTGAFNRRHMDTMLADALVQNARKEQELSLVMIDIDHFKTINDTFGHELGDHILKVLVKRLHEMIRESDLLFRIGGEEFVVLLRNCNIEQASKQAEKWRTALADISVPESGESITVSMGVSTLQGGANADDCLRQADSALYESKNGGRNRVTLFSAMPS